jgi:signal peptidase I
MKETLKRPTIDQLDAEISRRKYKTDVRKTVLSIVRLLIVVSAITVLLAVLWMPILRMYGESMSPTLKDANVVVAVKTGKMKDGEIVAFYYNNKILVKRVIATGGETVDIDASGVVYVDGSAITEPYLTNTVTQQGNITYPCKVPEGYAFVLGDNRAVSMDSRYSEIGLVSVDQVVGRAVVRIWPIDEIGIVE